MQGPAVSVVIATYNRGALLQTALRSVLEQEAENIEYEVIVVDNNSADDTRAVVERMIAERGGQAPTLRYVHEPRQGVSHARNAGIAHAMAPIVAFFDDDEQVSRDWVAQIKRAFDEHPEVEYVGGKVLPRWEREPPAWLTPHHWAPVAITDYGDEPVYGSVQNPVCLVSANLALRRRTFDRVGGFSPDLQRVEDGIGSMEDHELLIRVWRSGGRGLYVPNIKVQTEVKASRMEKKYHRRWHAGHGKFCADLRFEEITGPNGELLTEERPNATTLFGTPAFIYRQVLVYLSRFMIETLRRRTEESFYCENKVRYYANYIKRRYEKNQQEHARSGLGEVSAFAMALLRKKSQI